MSQFTRLITIIPPKADQKLSMERKSSDHETKKNIATFIITEKPPKVRIIIGRERILRMGFRKKLTRPKRAPAIKRLARLIFRLIPGIILAATKIASALLTMR